MIITHTLQFKRDEWPVTNAVSLDNVSTDHSTSFKYKSSLSPTADDNGVFKNMKIPLLLQYLCNFWRSLERQLTNFKIHLELNWSKNCVMSSIDGVTESKTQSCTFQLLLYQAKTMQNL